MQFEELEISKPLKRAIKDMQYKEMTPIQEASIPVLMENKDIIGQAKTGTGKTAAFAIPSIESVNREIRRTQILILCPTRELALQICEEFRKFTKYTQGIACEAVYGGASIERQIFALRKNPAIVIGTPGRILDHINRRVLRLKFLKTVILDEADEMLNMGFRNDIEKIFKSIPQERQTILFSATMPSDVLELAKTYQNSPVHINIKSSELTVDNIEQYYIDIPQTQKLNAVNAVFDKYKPKRAIIFCNTKKQVDKLLVQLKNKGFAADGLHGDIPQKIRTNVMNKFKKGELQTLIATDVAARGIDVKNIDIVLNYDIPSDMDFYIHRIGRTARAGKKGIAITLSCGKGQLSQIKTLERFTNSKIKSLDIPGLSVDSHDYSENAPLPKNARQRKNTTEDIARKIAVSHAKALKESGVRTKNNVPKISLDEYFKQSEKSSSEKLSDTPAGYGNYGRFSKNQSKIRTRYNGYKKKKI